MERENYRIVLEGVIEAFPDSPMIPLRRFANYLHKDVRTLQQDKYLMKLCQACGGRTEIARESAAHWMSGGRQ